MLHATFVALTLTLNLLVQHFHRLLSDMTTTTHFVTVKHFRNNGLEFSLISHL